MSLLFRSSIILLLCLATACSSIRNQNEWPSALPHKQYFVDYYNQDPAFQKITPLDTYLLWIQRFYFGWELYRRGWLKATEELVATLESPQEKLKGKRIMLAIGAKVSAEWAKDRTLRVINTRHMLIWGNALNHSVTGNNQFKVLKKIHQDVDALLARKIKPSDIKKSHYYEVEPFVTNIDDNGDF